MIIFIHIWVYYIYPLHLFICIPAYLSSVCIFLLALFPWKLNTPTILLKNDKHSKHRKPPYGPCWTFLFVFLVFMLIISLHFYVRLHFRFYNFINFFINERFCGMVKLVNTVSYYSITFSFPVDFILCFSFIWREWVMCFSYFFTVSNIAIHSQSWIDWHTHQL